MAFLGFAQVDRIGNINSTRFNNFITGSGGAIDISSAAKKIVFCGTFAVKGEQQITADGLKVIHPGKAKKFVDRVEQVTFSGTSAIDRGQSVFYVTERAVFTLTPDGVMLLEIAPGLDLQTDVLDMMEFRPLISTELKTIDAMVYRAEPLNLKQKFKEITQRQ